MSRISPHFNSNFAHTSICYINVISVNVCPTYSVLQRLVHEVFSPAEAHCTIPSTSMQPKNNVSIHTATESTPKADGKPVNRLQTVCEVTATDDKKLQLHQ